jgi:hypothetical protein
MHRLTRVLYPAYYALNTDFAHLAENIRWVHANGTPGRGYLYLLLDMLSCSLRHLASYEDYFDLRLYRMSTTERDEYVGTGSAFEFQSGMNERPYRRVFRSKHDFYLRFRDLMRRECIYLQIVDVADFADWVRTRPQVFAKPCFGNRGYGAEIISTGQYTASELYARLKNERRDFVEDLIVQHPEMQRLSPSAVNTVRIVTVLSGTEVTIIGAALRLGVDGIVDNLASGGIAAPIAIGSGIVTRPAVSKDIRTTGFAKHPSTGATIVGFEVPCWDEVLAMAERAARVVPQVRTVGWDIAVTDDGPLLVEGNDHWCKTLWQLPDGQGKRRILRQFLPQA